MAMTDDERRALDRTLERLVDDLDVEAAIIHLKSKEIFNDRDENCINVKATQLDKVREFVSRLKKRGDKAFPVFYSYLNESNGSRHLAVLLQQNLSRSGEKKKEKVLSTEPQPTGSSTVEKCDIFISYSQKSKAKVMELKTSIEARLQTNCWIDREKLLFFDKLDPKISQAILDAKVVLCMVDQNVVDSEECEKEVNFATEVKTPAIYIYLEALDKKPLKKSNGEISGLSLIYAPKLYCNQYNEDEDQKSEEFEILTKSISEFLKTDGATGTSIQ